jgi:hypothetical protein
MAQHSDDNCKYEQYLFSGSKNYTFDFSKKRVKENGKIMNKFDMGYVIEHSGNHYQGLLITVYEDLYNYEAIKAMLLEHLEQKQFGNVTIIK